MEGNGYCQITRYVERWFHACRQFLSPEQQNYPSRPKLNPMYSCRYLKEKTLLQITLAVLAVFQLNLVLKLAFELYSKTFLEILDSTLATFEHRQNFLCLMIKMYFLIIVVVVIIIIIIIIVINFEVCLGSKFIN